MKLQIIFLHFLVLLASGWTYAQPPSASPAKAIFIKAGRLLDIRSGHYIELAGILIQAEAATPT
jgi:hypothetical protein